MSVGERKEAPTIIAKLNKFERLCQRWTNSAGISRVIVQRPLAYDPRVATRQARAAAYSRRHIHEQCYTDGVTLFAMINDHYGRTSIETVRLRRWVTRPD
jgi:hypothetical protein